MLSVGGEEGGIQLNCVNLDDSDDVDDDGGGGGGAGSDQS